MRVLVDQAAPVVGDIAGNVARILGGVRAAAAAQAELVVGPELYLCGYPPLDLLARPAFRAACRRGVDEAVAATRGCGVTAIFGAPWEDGALRNAAVVARDGTIVGLAYKRLLPAYDVFDEPRHFSPGAAPVTVLIAGRSVGVTVCEDLWAIEGFTADARYGADPVLDLRGVDLLVNLSASPFHAGKAEQRRALLRAQARRGRSPVVYANQVGGNDHLLFDGRSMVVDGEGRLLAEGALFDEEHLLVDLDEPARPERVVSWGEEVYAGLVRGVRDYARRSGFRSALLGLSGGIDSALVAAIAVEALGAENVRGVALPGPYSSEGSLTDAAALARNLGISLDELGISPAWRALSDVVAPGMGGDTSGVVSENLQARARGAVLMALSNRTGALLLTTGNKSELAVGYCTLYGDMCGGLAVIGDLYKTEVYALAAWINRGREVIPRSTMTKAPSAELAPGQTDQDSLPSYPVLDAILRRHIEGGEDAEALSDVGDDGLVERILGLVRRSEHKRWQAPPVLRVSPCAFGYGRRVPLVRQGV